MGFFDDIVGTFVDLVPGARTVLGAVGVKPPESTFLPSFVTGLINPLTLIPDEVSATVGTAGILKALPIGGSQLTARPTVGPMGGTTMANGFFSDIFSAVGDVFAPASQGGFGDTLGELAGAALGAFTNTLTTQPQQLAARPLLPAIRGAGGLMTAMSSKFSARFPNLFATLSVLRDSGTKVTRSKAFTLLRNYGPSALIGLGFTAEAINELMVAGPGRRRMNPANVKALRRSLRRAESFNTLACRVQSQLSIYGRGGTRSTRARRCGKCRKSPCRC